jgi:thymidylate synthase
MVTTKKLHFKSIVYNCFVVLKGDTNIKYLQENGVKIWDAWADLDLGPVYGHQWRNWNSEEIDQIADLITELKTNKQSQNACSAWNPSVFQTTKSFEENVVTIKQRYRLATLSFNFMWPMVNYPASCTSAVLIYS